MPSITPFHRQGLLVVAMTLGAVAQVQAASPDAVRADQEFIRQQQRERALRQQQETAADIRPEPAQQQQLADSLPDSESPCFVIQRVQLQGELAPSFAWLLPASEHGGEAVVGRCLGTQGINVLLNRMQNALIAKGYVTTRVLVPPQNLASGTLNIAVLPGRIHAIHLADGTSGRATLRNAIPAKPGDTLNLRDIEQGLENLKRVPTVDADIKIAPAVGSDAQPGDSDLVVQWQQAFPLRLSVALDDSGSRATGRYQAGVTVSYDNWWTLNDLFYLSANRSVLIPDGPSKGTEGYTAHYEFPMGYWLLGASASQSRYHQTASGRNQSIVYSGDSSNGELKLSRVLYRDAQRKTGGYLLGWVRESRNYIDDTEVQVQHRRMAGWEAGITHREYLGSGSLDVHLGYRQGTGALAALAAPEQAFGGGDLSFADDHGGCSVRPAFPPVGR
ncbi:ShlB/FhaC/HecB family hemolysin secretion/activation protein [Vogesella amnigena]|uniref:ShlB/FhaC/HecB family hemolysin secretion/activation protein n=1 Tax=Vogesella amnigena TaxID=1507449 RepID=A0ABV7TXK9_9NEIS